MVRVHKIFYVAKSILTAGMLASSIVLANNFYVGGQVGFERGALDRTGFLTETLVTGGAEPTIKGDSSASYFSGGIYGGYKIELENNMTVAVEGDVFFLGEKKYTLHKPDITLKDATEYSIGLSVLGGYVIDEMFEVYGRLGLTASSIQFRRGSLEDGTGTVELAVKKRVRPVGLVLGAGVQMNLASLNESLENVSARLDYRYVRYQKKKMDLEPNNIIDRIEYKLSKHIVMLGVDYRF